MSHWSLFWHAASALQELKRKGSGSDACLLPISALCQEADLSDQRAVSDRIVLRCDKSFLYGQLLVMPHHHQDQTKYLLIYKCLRCMELKLFVKPTCDPFRNGSQGAAGAERGLCKHERVCNGQGRLCSTKLGWWCKSFRKTGWAQPHRQL